MGWRFSARFIITGLALKGLTAINPSSTTRRTVCHHEKVKVKVWVEVFHI